MIKIRKAAIFFKAVILAYVTIFATVTHTATSEWDKLYQEAEDLVTAGEHTQAKEVLKKALLLAEESDDQHHSKSAKTLLSLGLLSLLEEQHSEAEVWLERLLKTLENSVNPDELSVAEALYILGGVYRFDGQYEKAEPLAKRSMTMREKILGPDHLDVASSATNLASIYELQNRFELAEPLFKRALAITEKVQGPALDVAQYLNNLGFFYIKKGLAAEENYQANYSIWEKFLAGLLGLNIRYQDEANAQALPFLKRSLEIREKSLPPDHPDIGVSLLSLGIVYHLWGRYTQAEPFLKRSLAIFENAIASNASPLKIGLANPHLRDAYKTNIEHLAELYRKTRQEQKAIELERRLLSSSL